MMKLTDPKHLSKLWILVPADLLLLWILAIWLVPDSQTLMENEWTLPIPMQVGITVEFH
jgi:hypothetical protein